ncbi:MULTISPECIES: hypothetical protein [unclassified Flavobacterium]|uniref:hypothetical protein n=1 Tax=unclassified Flavobacterium TaxID=196869 RepID=UPI00070F35FD|nr:MULTISPECIES: hypothetical protein [unclassified Flavobacterium]KRD63253.1 hypothetical protein ASE40_04935 [Flavobacterium sp. Root935]MDQ1163859.1 membrane-associated HD superfamily phosphohydrolase [Flavobacterium sp. SORGH_AS_0622]TDX13779.1 hypothetical protein EDB96_0487 [Flavobacterium sp. S87F.05.LMB.W.Kidney.N]
MKKLLPIFSYILHPIFISLYATLFYLFYKGDIFSTQEKYFVLIQILVINVVVPVLFYLLLRSTGHVKSIMLSQTSERTIPLILQCFLYILLVKRSIVIIRYPELHFFFLGALFSTILALVSTLFKVKASLHMVAICGFAIFVIGLNIHLQMHNPYWPALLILLSGVVASSRLEMNAHTSREILIGLFIGIMPQLLFLYLWL